MNDQYYTKAAVPQGRGYRLHIEALAAPIGPLYPPCWDCDHEHLNAEEALNCPDYENIILRQVRLVTAGRE
jgi:hypothetical protein